MATSRKNNSEEEVQKAAKLIEDDNVLIPKKKIGFFLILELFKYVLLTISLLLVIYFSTDFFKSESKLGEFVASKFNSGTPHELVWTIIVIFFLATAVSFFKQRMTPGTTENFFVDDFLEEIPRTLYLFGASASSSLAALCFYIHQTNAALPEGTTLSELKTTAIMLFGAFFVIGAVIRVLTGDKYIKWKSKKG